MNNVFSNNLKKFRLQKNYTQEQVAEILGVSSHTISRWECGTTLPDVLLLPELARLYEVTTDDFYKEKSVVYENYAQRLAAVFENTLEVEDFMCCRNEYLKLIKSGELSIKDKYQFGWIHMVMMNHCRDTALEWYKKAIDDNPENDPQNHHIACMQRIWIYFLLNKSDEIIAEQEENAKNNPNNPRAIDNFIITLIWAKKFDEAYKYFEKAIQKFPEDWRIYIHGGDICKNLNRIDEALTYYNKAGEIGTYFCDELDCKANLYEDLGDFKKANEIFLEMADILCKRGYDVEAQMIERRAKECLEKI